MPLKSHCRRDGISDGRLQGTENFTNYKEVNSESVQTFTHTYIYIHMHIRIYVLYINVCVYIYIHTTIHMCINIYVEQRKMKQ